MTISRLRLAAVLAAALLASAVASTAARAETGEVRFAQQFGLGYLPIHIVREQRLIEKHAALLGLPDLRVSFQQVGTGSAATDMLLSGNLDMELGGVPILINLWDKTRGRQGVRGIMALCDTPFQFITVDPRLHSLRDFTAADRIAVTTVGISAPALIFQMAAQREMTPALAAQATSMEVPMSFPDAYAGMLSGKLEVKTQSTADPFARALLADGRARLLFSSYDVLGGPHTGGVLFTTTRWKEANPKAYQAIVAAFTEAQQFIRDHRDETAAIYAKLEPTSLPPDVVKQSVLSPELVCTATPHKIQALADAMNASGMLRAPPASWKDLFFENVHDLPGS